MGRAGLPGSGRRHSPRICRLPGRPHAAPCGGFPGIAREAWPSALSRPPKHRLADAIAEAGHSPVMLSKLASLEARIADLDRLMDACKPRDFSAAVAGARE